MSAMIMEAEASTALHTNVTLLDKFRLGIEIINDSCNLGFKLDDVGGSRMLVNLPFHQRSDCKIRNRQIR